MVILKISQDQLLALQLPPYVRKVKHKSQELIMAGDLTMPGTVNPLDVSATESTYLELD
jgi:hypothetical protein